MKTNCIIITYPVNDGNIPGIEITVRSHLETMKKFKGITIKNFKPEKELCPHCLGTFEALMERGVK